MSRTPPQAVGLAVRVSRGITQISINKTSPYTKLMGGLKKKKVEIDRKILAQLANKEPKIFEKIVEETTK